MRRKITNIICVFSVVLGMMPVNTSYSAADYDISTEKEILQGVGILKTEIPQSITYDFYVKALSGFLYSDAKYAGTGEDIARVTGMLDRGEKYTGAKVITRDDLIKYTVIAAGYKTLAQNYGGDYGAYKRVAAELGITDGARFSGGGVTAEDVVKVLRNLMDTEPMVRYYKSESETGYGIEYGETLLSLNRNIYEVKGVQNGNRYTTLYSPEGCGDGYITIDGMEFQVKDGYEDFLGKNVIAYVQETKRDEYAVLYITEYKNDVLDISSEEIEEVDGDCSYIEYMREGKVHKAKLSEAPSVVYNGVLFGGYTSADLNPDSGSVQLIDNDDDGKYDIVNVKSYVTVLADSINYSDKIIKNRYDYEGSSKITELEPDKTETEYVIRKDGEVIDITAVKPYDVLSIAENKSGEGRYIEILISGQMVEGTITGLNKAENEISVDGVSYTAGAEFLKHNSVNNLAEIGRGGEFYLDSFGKIAYFVPGTDNEYYMILKFYEEDEKYYAVYMDINEQWYTTPLAGKINYNGDSIKASAIYESELKHIKPEVVQLELNSSGELKKLDRATETAEYTEGEFIKTPEAVYTYRYYEQHFDHKYYLNEGAKAFILPEEYTSDKTAYSVQTVTTLFSTDVSGCQLSVYDFDKFNFTDVISIKDNDALESSRSTLNLFVVKDIGDKLINGDVVYGITGNMVNYRNLILGAEKPEILDNVEIGDIVRLSINGAGEISGVSHVASARNFVPLEYNGYTTNAIMAGTVSKVDLGEGKIKISFGANEKNFRLNTTLGVLTYDVEENECSFDDISSVTEDKNIICRLKMGRIEEIIVIEGRYKD